MSAIDILEDLDGYEVNSLEPLQRVLLVTDGTLTEILEANFFERIRLVQVSQRIVPAGDDHALLDLVAGEAVSERKILLQGVDSRRNYVYAESMIALDRLSPAFREELLNSRTPPGRLWLEQRPETSKELMEIRGQRANGLCAYFECNNAAPMLARTYRISSAGQPLIVTTEYFPAAYQSFAERTSSKLDQLAGSCRRARSRNLSASRPSAIA